MTKKRKMKGRRHHRQHTTTAHLSSSVEELRLAALARGGNAFETGRLLVTYKENAAAQGLKSLTARRLRVASTRDFGTGAPTPPALAGADAMVFGELGVTLLSGDAAQAHAMTGDVEIDANSPIQAIDPEYFFFTEGVYGGSPIGSARLPGEVASSLTLLGAAPILETIANALEPRQVELAIQEESAIAGATWGLTACRVPLSARSGVGIKVAILGTGMDLGHPDFAGRSIVSQQFVGEPVQDLNGHGTHMVGTACGPKLSPGNNPRYGIGHRTQIFVGKILGNSGAGTTATILSGMNWAIGNLCEVIFIPIAMMGGPHAVFTAAGHAALNKGLLMIAGSSSGGLTVGAPANSPTIMSVGALDPMLTPSAFSPTGKIDIAAPGRDIFSSWTRPIRYKTISGLASAGAHVTGCAALWAQHSNAARGMNLWNALQRSAKTLAFPASRVGAGLVQAP